MAAADGSCGRNKRKERAANRVKGDPSRASAPAARIAHLPDPQLLQLILAHFTLTLWMTHRNTLSSTTDDIIMYSTTEQDDFRVFYIAILDEVVR